MLLLAPDSQEQALALEAVDGVEPIGERALRGVAHAGTWGQRGPPASASAPSQTQTTVTATRRQLNDAGREPPSGIPKVVSAHVLSYYMLYYVG